ncbi:hypothetical protein NJ7G_3027 [Natrinema sp. J7-2]|nr:hypothetical protein NJ7G_3027 [Natrinema sp. J7-2]
MSWTVSLSLVDPPLPEHPATAVERQLPPAASTRLRESVVEDIIHRWLLDRYILPGDRTAEAASLNAPL